MRSLSERVSWLVLCGSVLCGCATQMGVSGGHRAEDGGPDSALWSTHVAALHAPAPGDHGVLGGVEIESAVGDNEGARWNGGARFGYAWSPPSDTYALGYELHLDGGTQLTQASLFADGNFYAGATAAIVMWLDEHRDLSDLNDEPWLITPVPQLVLYTRARAIHAVDCPFQDPKCLRGSAELGVALRMSLLSELF